MPTMPIQLTVSVTTWLLALVLAGPVTATVASPGPAVLDEQWLTHTAPAVGDSFGAAVALSGDVLVVGAPRRMVGLDEDQGTVTVFRKLSGTWVHEAELTSPSAAADDWFGRDVALDGELLVVGVPRPTGPGNGRAEVFRWNGSSWAFESSLVPAVLAPFSAFGEVVAAHGDRVAVAAPHHDLTANGQEGSVTVFRWDGASWAEEQTLWASDAQPIDHLGWGLALEGDLLAVGVNLDDVGAAQNRGSVRTWRFNGATWVEEQTLLDPAGAAGDLLGTSVALGGDVLVAGATSADPQGISSAGAASVFRWDGAAFQHEQTVRACDGQTFEFFGFSAAVSGDTIVIGEPFDTSTGSVNGAASVFRWDGIAWHLEHIKDLDGPFFSLGGYSVDLSGNDLIVSDPDWEGEGAVIAYDLSGDGAWRDLGGGTGGAAGSPRCCWEGTLEAGSPLSLIVSHAVQGAPALGWISLAPTPFPAVGGTVHAWPFVSQLPLVIGSGGQKVLGTSWPTGLPSGTQVWFQFVLQDLSVPHGLTLTNGVRATSP